MHHVGQGVVVLLLPAMTMNSVLHVVATFRIFGDVPGRPPIIALASVVLEQVRLPSEVLPVVGVHTISLVVILAERAPFGLEKEHIEIGIFR